MGLSLKKPEYTRALAFVLGTGLRRASCRFCSRKGRASRVDAPEPRVQGALAHGARAGRGGSGARPSEPGDTGVGAHVRVTVGVFSERATRSP